jgi:hypothetical protein
VNKPDMLTILRNADLAEPRTVEDVLARIKTVSEDAYEIAIQRYVNKRPWKELPGILFMCERNAQRKLKIAIQKACDKPEGWCI